MNSRAAPRREPGNAKFGSDTQRLISSLGSMLRKPAKHAPAKKAIAPAILRRETHDAEEIQQLMDDFRSARAVPREAQAVINQAYASFLAAKGSGPSAEQLKHLHTAHLAEHAACLRYAG